VFDLHITCTKDITFLKINFADGTSVVGENVEKDKDFKENSEKTYSPSNYVANNNSTIQSYKKVKLPDIEDKHRNTVKVADELQDLEL
jgi:hypothetical protein